MKNRIGEKHITNEGYNIEIIEYFNNKNITVEFLDGTTLKNICYNAIEKGQIKNPFHKSVVGIGFLGVGNFKTKINNKSEKYYCLWASMLKRCYDKEYHTKKPTYKDCSVDERWHNFQNFAKWLDNNYVDGFELDKDILFKGNKIYSPETCCFVPKEVNVLFTSRFSKRGEYVIGVSSSKSKNMFESSLSVEGKTIHLGSFKTEIEAFKMYKGCKETYIKQLAEKYKHQISNTCYKALCNYKIKITD